MSKFKDELKSSQKCKNIDDVIDTYFMEPLGLFFARIFIKLHMSPNMVTILNGIVGSIGGLMLLHSNIYLRLVGVFFILLGAIFDCSDGQVARLTNKRSEIGRLLDGIFDGVVYTCIWLGLSLRLMNTNIPFTNVKWGAWILLVFGVTGLIFQCGQQRMADYFRNVHMFFANGKGGNEHSSSRKEKEKIKNTHGFNLKHFGAIFYYIYTKIQESSTPKTQALFEKIDEMDEIPASISEFYIKQSSKYIHLMNSQTYNLRTFVLFALIITNCFVDVGWSLELIIVPFTIIIIEGLKIFLKHKYEKIAVMTLRKCEEYEEQV